VGGHDAANAGCLRCAADRAQILRILQAVQHQQDGIGVIDKRRSGHRLELPIFSRADVGHDALMRLRMRDVVKLSPVGWLDRDLARRGQLAELLQPRFIAQAIGK
jgi:hypothetical protein